MSHWLDLPRARQDTVTVPRIWMTIALSIIIHVAVLLLIPQPRVSTPGNQDQDQTSDRLQVVLAAPPRPSSPPAERAPTVRAPQRSPATTPRTLLRMRPPPPVVTLPNPEAAIVVPPPPPPPAVATPRPNPPLEGDLAAYIEARRRERGAQQSAANDLDTAQFNRAIAANLPAPARGVDTQDSKKGGGIFGIKRMTYDDAAFEFYGWNKEMGRKTPQLIEVRKGNNSDMRIAVVRRMIAIVREFEKEDFTWESPRLGHNVILSARLSDNAALEDFLMREFFDGGRGHQ